ncbi:MAG: hypothetical protein Q7U53_17560 [Anaerolineaceae bacterium]|nr:hypothetical protein [Anaerolineaceae bacterium]
MNKRLRIYFYSLLILIPVIVISFISINEITLFFRPLLLNLDLTNIIAILALLISILTLLISILTLLNNREITKLNIQMYSDIQIERNKNKFTITLLEAFKDDSENRIDGLWGMKFSLKNRGQDIPLINNIYIELIFKRRNKPFDFKNLFLNTLLYEEEYVIGFSYEVSGEEIGRKQVSGKIHGSYPRIESEDLANKTIYLIDWETKEPINLGTLLNRIVLKGPNPNERKIWMLFGYIPSNWRITVENLTNYDWYLSKIKSTFIVDDEEFVFQTRVGYAGYLNCEFRELLDEISYRVKEENFLKKKKVFKNN